MKSRRDDAELGEAVAIREQELWDRERPRYDAIMERNVRLPVIVVVAGEEDGCGGGPSTALDVVRRKRLVYCSKRRG